MDLLPVTLIIGLLVFTSPIYLSHQDVIFHCCEHQELNGTNVYPSNGNFKHLKFLKSRFPYNVNSTSSFQLELLKSMDVNPNPGPPSPSNLPNTSDDSQLPKYVYSTATLRALNPYKQISKPHLPAEIWNNIKMLKLNRSSITRRRKRGGRRKPWFTTSHHMDIEHTDSPISSLTTSRRPAVSTLRHPDQPNGPNVTNLKTLPKFNPNMVSGTKVCLWNARSTRNKHIELTDYICTNDVDIMIIVESWLDSESDSVIIGFCTPPGYSFLNIPRDSVNRGGGIAVVFKTPMKLIIKQIISVYTTFEYAHITNNSHSINFVVVYRPPPSTENGLTNSMFLDEFEQFATEISLLPGKLILLGDFNVHWEKPAKSDVIRFSNATNSSRFVQHVSGPTHKDGHTLDLVFTRTDETLLKDCHTEDKLMSDHRVICFTLDLPKPKPMKIVSTLRKYHDIDKDKFAKSLDELISNKPSRICQDSNAMFEWYDSEMKCLLDLYAPQTTRTRIVKNRMPYYNDSIHTARRERRRAERKWRKSNSELDCELYLNAKRNVNNLIMSAKQAFFKDKLSSCSTKDVYRTINSLLNKNVQHLPYYDSAADLANQFSSYFVNKIVNIRKELDSENVIIPAHFCDSPPDNITPLEVLRPTNEEELLKIINSSASKTSRLDPIPTWYLKDNLTQLLPVLTDIVNSSLSSGVFPKGAHSAIIRPLLKKPTLDENTLKNYRPIANITFVGKLIEKVACSRLTEHMDLNHLVDPHQSAYRALHSTESALIKVKNDIMFSLDANRAVLLVLLDLSAAFDTIDHNILISRLSQRICVKGAALNWFSSYLANWSTQVDIAGELSDPVIAQFGLPQGSVVGPVGYSLYTLPVGDIAKHHNVSHHVYADDTQLYVSFDPKVPGDLSCAITRLQYCISDIKNWMTANKLKLNDSKTEFFIAASSNNHKKHIPPNITLSIGSANIEPSKTIRNLGAFFDSEMTMLSHVTNVSKTVTFHLRNIGRIRKYIDQPTCHHAVRSLILSRLDYCNGLLSLIPSTYMIRLQRLQNWAARLIFEVDRKHSPRPLLKSLHWLPIQQRINFKLLLCVYKCLHNQGPSYLTNCLTLYVPGRQLRSSKDYLRLKYPITRVLAGDRTFTVSASKAWNELPTCIRQSSSTSVFKKALKTYLFP